PVLLLWEVEFFPAAGGNNLDPADRRYRSGYVMDTYDLPGGEADLVPRPGRDIPDKAANLYAGRTVLSPAARPLLSARVLGYLTGAILPAYNAGRTAPLPAAAFADDPEPVLTWYGTHGTDQPIHTLIAVYRHLREHESSNLAQALGGFTEALLMRKLVRQLPIADPLGFPPYQRLAAEVAAAVGSDSTHAPVPLSDFNPIRAGAMRLLQLRIVDNFGVSLDVDVSRIATTTQLRVPGRADWVAMPPRLAQPARMTARWLDGEHELAEMNNLPDSSPVCGWLLPDNLDGGLAVYEASGTLVGTLGATRWDPAPGASGEIANPHLREVVERLRAMGPGGLTAFSARLEDTLDLIEPEEAARHAGMAPLAGRPIAVARMELSLDLMGPPALHQDWNVFRRDLRRTSRQDDDFPLVRFPLRVGDPARLGDGVIGYWVAGEEEFTDATAVLEQAPFMPPTRLTLLLDPRCPVHVTSGVLPGRTLRIPAEHYQDALTGMEIDFFTGPVLAGPGTPALPLPAEPGYAWFWVARDGDAWTRAPLEPGPGAEQTPDILFARDGWLAIRPTSPGAP
ncbi:MAG: hypothetical protein HOY71_13020, partial [Nonomuraea sp.]|nr:hypothetical protein [Nonomuraea sp.]